MANVADGGAGLLPPQIQAALATLVKQTEGLDDSEKADLMDHLEKVS